MNQTPRFARTCPDMLVKLIRLAMPAALAVCMLAAAGCTSRSLTRAPVEDRGTNARAVPAVVAESVDVKQLPGSENAGKPGYYTVRPGDTMIRIGLDSGQNWRDIVRWNNLENPNLIEVGQVLRVVPPVGETQVVTRPVSPGSTAPATATPPLAAASRPASAPAAPVAPVASPAPAPVTPPPPVAASPALTGDEDVGWIWPAQGALLSGFDDAKNKGLDIGGRAGDAVIAAADGRVVYSGAGLRGYGNLIILKHNNTFLTAYAHNQTLLVKEDQTVKKGQKIAEMGNSDADRVKLHFEIRRQGKPVDPAKYLPPR
jgi:lipoprotein NlpD